MKIYNATKFKKPPDGLIPCTVMTRALTEKPIWTENVVQWWAMQAARNGGVLMLDPEVDPADGTLKSIDTRNDLYVNALNQASSYIPGVGQTYGLTKGVYNSPQSVGALFKNQTAGAFPQYLSAFFIDLISTFWDVNCGQYPRVIPTGNPPVAELSDVFFPSYYAVQDDDRDFGYQWELATRLIYGFSVGFEKKRPIIPVIKPYRANGDQFTADQFRNRLCCLAEIKVEGKPIVSGVAIWWPDDKKDWPKDEPWAQEVVRAMSF